MGNGMIYFGLVLHVFLAVVALTLLSTTLQSDGALLDRLWPPSLPLMSGIVLYGMSFLVWLWLLGNANASRLYPITVGLITGGLLAISYYQGQPIQWYGAIGLGLILVGVALVSASGFR